MLKSVDSPGRDSPVSAFQSGRLSLRDSFGNSGWYRGGAFPSSLNGRRIFYFEGKEAGMENKLFYSTDQWIWDDPMLIRRLSLGVKTINLKTIVLHDSFCMQFMFV
jgi:hypothetical protein